MEPDKTQNQGNEVSESKHMLVSEAWILTPKDYNRIRDGFKQQSHKLLFDGMLYTGMRIEEFWRFIEHPEWFNYERSYIQLPIGSIKKPEAKQKERKVLLSALGTRICKELLDAVRRGEIKHISRRGWSDDLMRAAKRAGIKDTTGLTPKMARKTYISWLMAVMPEDGLRISSSSGHDTQTMIAHYLSTPFTDDERKEIKMHVQGWGGRSI